MKIRNKVNLNLFWRKPQRSRRHVHSMSRDVTARNKSPSKRFPFGPQYIKIGPHRDIYILHGYTTSDKNKNSCRRLRTKLKGTGWVMGGPNPWPRER